MKKADQPLLAPGTLNRLLDYQWPGNVRELQNIVERALIRHTQGPLRVTDMVLLQNDKHPETRHRYAQDRLLPLETMITAHIRRALVLANGKIHGPGGAADLLGINPNTLRKKMDKLQVPYKKKGAGRHVSTRNPMLHHET